VMCELRGLETINFLSSLDCFVFLDETIYVPAKCCLFWTS
jgi:hypothetical protein